MAKAVIAVALLAMVSNAMGQEGQLCHTNVITPHHFFNMSKWLGNWYVVADAAGLKEDVHPLTEKCIMVNFHARQNQTNEFGALVRSVDIETNMPISENNYVRIEDFPAKWKYYDLDQSGTHLEYDVVMLQTDFNNWGVAYVCIRIDGYRYEQIMMLSRRSVPDTRTVDDLRAMAYAYGFPYENHRIIEQRLC